MDPSIPLRSSARPIPSMSSSLMDKFLGLSVSPSSSLQSFSPDDATSDAIELDEEEIWDMDISSGSYDGGSNRISTLPPRIFHGNRRLSSNMVTESRSPLKDGASASRISSSNGQTLTSVSGMSPASSSSASLSNGVRVQTAKVLSGETATRRIPSASRMISRIAQQHGEGNSSSSNHFAMAPQSAPINIPNWSQMEARHHGRQCKPRAALDPDVSEGKDDVSEGEDGERLPPHQFLAREYARSQQTSFSVLEGAGRTLKGRDLRRVRNAVLTYTGFVE